MMSLGNLQIGCVECHQTMDIKYLIRMEIKDAVLVAAECACGRLLGEIDGQTLHIVARNPERPLTSSDIKSDDSACVAAPRIIERAKERIVNAERLIAVGTWVRDKPRRQP